MTQHHAKRLFFKSSLLALGLMQSLPALAQGAPNNEPAKDPKLVIELKALTQTFEELRSKPADTVAENGGKMEGAILSAYAIREAAAKIKQSAQIQGKILVAGYDDAIGSDIYALYQLEYAQICKQLGGCARAEGGESDFRKFAVAPVIGAVLPAFSSLLRSETEVDNLEGGLTDNRLLASAVAKAHGNNAIILVPARMTSIKFDDATITELESLKKARDLAAALPKKKTAVEAAGAFFKALYTVDTDGKIKLLDVIKARQISEAMKDRKLLRVKIENSSGTLLKRKNLWVALGAPAVAASGGLIATYALDEGDGTSVKQGMVLCQAGVKNLRKIHKLDETHNSRCKML
jgi:hypothetical protein